MNMTGSLVLPKCCPITLIECCVKGKLFFILQSLHLRYNNGILIFFWIYLSSLQKSLLIPDSSRANGKNATSTNNSLSVPDSCRAN
jgi:hypothetical protein